MVMPGGVAIGTHWGWVKDAVTCSTMHRIDPHNSELAPNINIAETEKPSCKTKRKRMSVCSLETLVQNLKNLCCKFYVLKNFFFLQRTLQFPNVLALPVLDLQATLRAP